MYKIIGERGLWDDFNRSAYNDKPISADLFKAIVDSVEEIDIDFDEIQKQLNEECSSRRRRRKG